MTTPPANFWAGRDPCWVIMDCSRFLRRKCAAYLHPEKPCWNHETTQCEAVLGIPKDCPTCIIYRRYKS